MTYANAPASFSTSSLHLESLSRFIKYFLNLLHRFWSRSGRLTFSLREKG